VEFLVFVILAIVFGVVGKIKQAQKTGKTEFKWPTPKSWQLPAAGQGPGGMIQQLQGQAPPNAPQGPPGVVPAPGFTPPAGWVLPGAPPAQLPQQFARPPHHRPPQHQLPAQQSELDNRVRELMTKDQEVTAVLLLGEELGMGIVEAQEYARRLAPSAAVAPQQPAQQPARQKPRQAAEATTEPAEQYEYLGSAAIASSLFEVEDDDVWASGWVDTPEPDDRSDIEELWQTVRDGGRPRPGTEPDLEV
jgi:hypothetical protein